MTKQRFADKVFIITGAAGGIGYSIAEMAAREGASIVFFDLKEGIGKQARDKLRKLNPAVDFLPIDMTIKENVQDLVDFTVNKYGRVDVLINNAGVLGVKGAIHNIEDISSFKKVLDCNVMTMVYCSHYVVNQMLKQTSESAIVNIASIAGMIGFPGNIAYGTSKHAVIGLTKCMALDYATKGIRVNSVSPGVIQTPMLDAGIDRVNENRKAPGKEPALPNHLLSPQNRVAAPAEVANAVLFLVSDEASHITGVNLPVDGGFTT